MMAGTRTATLLRLRRAGKLAWSVLSSLTEIPIRSGPHAGLEIASLHVPTLARQMMTAYLKVPRFTPTGTADGA
jgi:hypothetical protein